MNNDYFRKFVTLSHENGEYGKSFGTTVLEHRNGINKITLSISNVRPNVYFCLTLIKVFDSKATFVDTFSFKSDNSGNAYCKEAVSQKTLHNINLSDFDVCIVKINDTPELITPLVGYCGNKVKWRDYYVKPTKQIEQTPKQKEIKELKKEEKIEEIIKPIIKPYEFGFNNEKRPEKHPLEKIYVDNKTETEQPQVINNNPHKHSIKLNSTEIAKKYKLPKIEHKKSSIELITDIDDFDYKDDNIKIKNNDEDMLENIKVEIKKLKDLALSSYEKDTKCSFENLEDLPNSISEIFDKNSPLVPFKNNATDVDWVIIDYSDLAIVDTKNEFVKNPFLRNSYKKFSHFILGRCNEEDCEVFMLGVPDFFNHEYEENIRNLGFMSFKESTIGVQQGYWIIVL